jgi:signal peptidase II
VKGKHVALLIIAILVADQILKIYIKTNYYLGEEHNMLGSWFRLHFVENKGMAWGWEFGDGFGKIALTLFRLVAVIAGTFYLRHIVQKQMHKGFIVCASLIYAGAAGNLIDSMFYGMIFENSDYYVQNVANFTAFGKGYASFLHGKVVDMLYFPIIQIEKMPTWMPFLGGQPFEFFSPVFNLADAAISTGVIALFIWQKKWMPDNKPAAETSEPASTETDNS